MERALDRKVAIEFTVGEVIHLYALLKRMAQLNRENAESGAVALEKLAVKLRESVETKKEAGDVG